MKLLGLLYLLVCGALSVARGAEAMAMRLMGGGR
jgi:hypothetical protein